MPYHFVRRFLHRACQAILLTLVLLLAAGPVLTLQTQAAPAEAPTQQDAPPAPGQPQVVTIWFTTPEQLGELTSRLDVWEVNHAAGSLVAMVSPLKLAALQQSGYRVEVDPARTQAANRPLENLPGQTAGIPGYPCYRTVEETYTDMQAIATSKPQLAQWIDIGNSWEKDTPGGLAGYDIHALILTNRSIGGPKPVFFLMAEAHARELVTSETAARFAEYLVSRYGTDPDITWLLDYYQVHIVTHTNPDGRKNAEAGASWRKNTDNDDGCSSSSSWGTDLNRNSSFHWGGAGASTNPCDDTYRGPSAASEPEVQAVQNYMLSIFQDQRGPADTDPAPATTTGSMITLHSYSELVLWPWGDISTPAPNATQLQTLGRKMAYFNDYTPQQSVGLYPTTGATDDWAYGILGISAYTFEMGTTFFQSCSTFENTIYPDNLQALLYAAKAARRPYQLPAGPETLSVSVQPGPNPDDSTVIISAIANDTRYAGGEASQIIAAARYTIDTPPWVAGAVYYPMAATDGTFNSNIEAVSATLDTSKLSAGRHTIFIESKDQNENWGVVASTFVSGDLALAPRDQTRIGRPGEAVTYTLTLTNTRALADTYNVTRYENPWTVISPDVIGPLQPGQSQTFDVIVNIPQTAAQGEENTAALTFTSRSDSTIKANAHLTTVVAQYGVSVIPDQNQAAAKPGERAIHTLQILNTGNVPDTFDLSLSASAWPAALSSTSLTIDPSRQAPVNIGVDVPITVDVLATEPLTVTIVSRSDPAKIAVASLITSVQPHSGLMITPTKEQRIAFAGETAEYTLVISNTGSLSDTYDIQTSGKWGITLQPDHLTLEGRSSATATIRVAVPAGAKSGAKDMTFVAVASRFRPALLRTAVLTTVVRSPHSLGLSPQTVQAFGKPGEVLTYTLALSNTGKTVTTYALQLENNGWEASIPQSEVVLDAGDHTNLIINATIPPGTPAGVSHLITLDVQAVEDETQSAQADLTALVEAAYGLTAKPADPSNTATGAPGETLVFTLHITNTGNITDTFEVQVAPADWPAAVLPEAITLAPGASGSAAIQVEIPAQPEVDEVALGVQVASQGDAMQMAQLSFSARALPPEWRNFLGLIFQH